MQVAGRDLIVAAHHVSRNEITPDDRHLAREQRTALLRVIHELAERMPAATGRPNLAAVHRMLQRRYGVASYLLIPRERYADALQFADVISGDGWYSESIVAISRCSRPVVLPAASSSRSARTTFPSAVRVPRTNGSVILPSGRTRTSLWPPPDRAAQGYMQLVCDLRALLGSCPARSHEARNTFGCSIALQEARPLQERRYFLPQEHARTRDFPEPLNRAEKGVQPRGIGRNQFQLQPYHRACRLLRHPVSLCSDMRKLCRNFRGPFPVAEGDERLLAD